MENLFLATAKLFEKTNEDGSIKVDKNGKKSVILYCIAGRTPNRNILSGTVAEREGFEVGKSYLVSYQEREANEDYGRQFNFTKVAEASVADILGGVATLGKAEVFSVDSNTTTSQEEAEVVIAEEAK